MTVATPIQFTQDQMRTLTGVSVETLRHWRKTVPYLSSKMGKVARFTFADLLGLAVTNELVNSFGVNIATVNTGIDALFRLLATTNSTSLDGAVAFVTPTAASLHNVDPKGIELISMRATLVIPLAPLIGRIQQHMLPIMPAPSQAVLPFPPEAVRSRA